MINKQAADQAAGSSRDRAVTIENQHHQRAASISTIHLGQTRL